MGYDAECLSAALISAGAKGAISIHEDEKFLGTTYTVKNEDRSQYDQLSADERILVHNLLKGESEIELKQTNRVRIQSAIKKFQDYLKESLEGRCYQKNGKWVWLGVPQCSCLSWVGCADLHQSRCCRIHYALVELLVNSRRGIIVGCLYSLESGIKDG